MSRYLPWLDLSMYIYMSRYLFTCLQITGCLCNYLYVFDCLLYLPVYEFACLSVYLPVYVFACLSTCLSMNLLVCICTWGCLWICLLVYVFACLCICLSIYLPVYEFACLYMYLGLSMNLLACLCICLSMYLPIYVFACLWSLWICLPVNVHAKYFLVYVLFSCLCMYVWILSHEIWLSHSANI
jgi:hypothetical protein